jgi:glycosyltransferase involved in cell wall biosynthesis
MSQQSPPDARRLRVLLLMERQTTGGAERRFLRLAQGLPRDAFDVRVGVLATGGELAAEFVETDLPIVPIVRRWRYDLTPALRVARYCRRERVSVVHAMHWLSGVYAALAARWNPGTAAIGSTVGHIYDAAAGGTTRRLADRLLHGSLAAMMVNTPSLRDYLIGHGYPADRIVVIENGVVVPDLGDVEARRAMQRERWSIPPDAPCVGMLARLEPVKDHATLLRAARIVCDAHPAARFVLAGEGSQREPLEALAAELALTGNVIFTGLVKGAQDVAAAWDVAAHPSLHEGQSNAILEALAWSKPVVATAVGGTPELVLPGTTGSLVPPRDPAALAAALIDLIEDPARACAWGRAGRQMVIERWSAEAMVRRYDDLYRACAKKAARQPARG